MTTIRRGNLCPHRAKHHLRLEHLIFNQQNICDSRSLSNRDHTQLSLFQTASQVLNWPIAIPASRQTSLFNRGSEGR